jgi:transposase-like protein
MAAKQVWFRALEESVAERGALIDHVTIDRWITDHSPR